MPRVTIASVVRKLVLSRPVITSCLLAGIVNYSALARYLLPEVKEVLGKKEISLDAVKVALVRVAKELRSEFRGIEDKILYVIAKSALRLETDLVVVTVSREYGHVKLGDLASKLRNARFLQITQGVSGFTIVLSSELLSDLKEVLGESAILNVMDNQSAIVLISPKEIIYVPGVVAYITNLLAWRGINITQIISCYLDTILIMNREDALNAYVVLEDLIKKVRKLIRKSHM